MPSHDLHSNIKREKHFACAAYTSTQTPSNGIDTKGFESCEFVIIIGTITNIAQSPTPSWAFKLQESDSQSSGFTDVTSAASVIYGSANSPAGAPDTSTGVFLLVDAAAEDDEVYRIGYRGSKRYVRCVATASEVPGSTPIAIIAELGHPSDAPVSD